ncbi:MAG: FHA domain-containing protein [Myxococcota bacterium]|nr:FHA domain-containing protein [Myxococcota bacterium]
MSVGAVVVWSGDKPRLDTLRIPSRGVVFGRDQADASDDRISAQHVRLATIGQHVAIEDLASRNGTFINGMALRRVEQLGLPALMRAGHTLAMLVADVRPYEGVTLARRGKLVCATTLAPACSIVDIAARAEEHLGIFGPMNIGRALAHDYAETVGGERVVADLNVVKLTTLVEKLAGARPRTMILELDRPLTHPDQPELEAWLETDVRIVSVARDLDAFKFMPVELMKRMTPRAVELPHYRFDELPTTFAETIAAHGARAHATLIEAALMQLRNMGEETLLRYLETVAKRCKKNGLVRGRDLDEHIQTDQLMRHCVAGVTPRRP